MSNQTDDFGENPARKSPKVLILFQICLRVCVFAASLVSALIMLRSKEIVSVYGFIFVAKYSSGATYKFFAYANLSVCVLAAVTLPFAFLFGVRGRPNSYFLLFLCDLAMLVVVLGASSAASAEGYLGKYGNIAAGWNPICTFLQKYCDKALVSLILSFCSVFLLLPLTVLTAFQSRPNLVIGLETNRTG